MAETDLKHKVLAVVEEEGAERASYALKLLQSEGQLTIASTGKDPDTDELITHEYRVEGPVMIMLTTTAVELNEELVNRALVLTVDEDRDQTRAIHQLVMSDASALVMRRRRLRYDARADACPVLRDLRRPTPRRLTPCPHERVWCRRIAECERSASEGEPSIEDCHWTKRLGEMARTGDDYWWVLRAKPNDQEGLKKFTQALVHHAVPYVQAMASDEALRDLWLTGNGPGLTSVQRLIYLSILLREIGPTPALPAVIDQLNEQSSGKPVRARVQAHLKRFTTLAGNADAAN